LKNIACRKSAFSWNRRFRGSLLYLPKTTRANPSSSALRIAAFPLNRLGLRPYRFWRPVSSCSKVMPPSVSPQSTRRASRSAAVTGIAPSVAALAMSIPDDATQSAISSVGTTRVSSVQKGPR
jgi:hypothetical protein